MDTILLTTGWVVQGFFFGLGIFAATAAIEQVKRLGHHLWSRHAD